MLKPILAEAQPVASRKTIESRNFRILHNLNCVIIRFACDLLNILCDLMRYDCYRTCIQNCEKNIRDIQFWHQQIGMSIFSSVESIQKLLMVSRYLNFRYKGFQSISLPSKFRHQYLGQPFSCQFGATKKIWWKPGTNIWYWSTTRYRCLFYSRTVVLMEPLSKCWNRDWRQNSHSINSTLIVPKWLRKQRHLTIWNLLCW